MVRLQRGNPRLRAVTPPKLPSPRHFGVQARDPRFAAVFLFSDASRRGGAPRGVQGEGPASLTPTSRRLAFKRRQRGGTGPGGGALGAPALWLHLCRRTKVENSLAH